MATSTSSGNKKSKGGKGKSGSTAAMFPDALREAGQRAAELAQNPVARSMLAAGLVTAAAALTANAKVRKTVSDAAKIEEAKAVGKLVAERAKGAGISKVVFDRGGYLYHGRVKALLDATREAGLNKAEAGEAPNKEDNGN